MRREHNISSLVYHHLYPHPSPSDPPDFAAHLAKHLVAEVRIETQRFYGGLETVEARYPGLNYSHPPHRKRLGRFQHHARLFRAFDELRLTEHEIGMLCRWEGTLWARQRYERDEGVPVLDTTGNDIMPWVDRRPTRRGSGRTTREKAARIKVKTDIEVEIEDAEPVHARVRARPRAVAVDVDLDSEMADAPMSMSMPMPQAHIAVVVDDDDDNNSDNSDDDDDDQVESVGVELNARLVAAVAAREELGLDADVALDPAWEAYLKEAAENGTASLAGMSSSSSTLHAQQAIQQALNAARATSAAAAAAAAASASSDPTGISAQGPHRTVLQQ